MLRNTQTKTKPRKREKNHLQNENVPRSTIIFPATISMPVRMAVPVSSRVPLTCVLSQRMTVSLVRMHPNNVHPATSLFPKHLLVPLLTLHRPQNPRLQSRIGGFNPDSPLGRPNHPLFALVILGSQGIDEEGEERSHHGEKPSKGELGPWVIGQAFVGEGVPSGREHVYEPCGKDDAGGECLGGYEEIAVSSEEAAVLSNDGDGDSDGSSDEDRRDGDGFEDKCDWFVSAAV